MALMVPIRPEATLRFSRTWKGTPGPGSPLLARGRVTRGAVVSLEECGAEM